MSAPRRRLLLGALITLGWVGAPGTASADAGFGPVGPFGAVVPVSAANVGPPVATFGLDGTLLVAWTGQGHFEGSPPSGQEGVTIAERRPGELTPTPALRLTPAGDGINRSAAAVDVGDDGTRAVAWVDQPDRAPGAVRLALARRGEGFGEPESVPVPLSPTGMDVPSVGPVTVAVAPDGRVVLGVTQGASDTVAGGALAVIRETSGAYGSPQTLNPTSFQQPVTMRATGGGEVLALHVDTPRDAVTPRRVLVSRLAPGAGGFGAPEEITVPGGAMVSGEDALLATNRSGQAVVSFAAAATSQMLFPDRVVASRRRPDGGFAPATTVLSGVGLIRRPGAAIGAAGDALVVSTGSNLLAAFSPPRGPGFDAQDPPVTSRGSNASPTVGVDATGGAVVIQMDEGDRSTDSLLAYLRPAGGPLAQVPFSVNLPRSRSAEPVLATDVYGNGVLVWIGFGRGSRGLFARSYSTTRPVLLSGGRPSATAVPVRLSEPASVRVEVLRTVRASRTRTRTRRVARFVARVQAGRRRVALPARVRRARTRPGRLVARLIADDGGPQRSKRLSVTLRRR